ncbi:MAG: ABC transporter permease [Planctomycetota bacterium]
MTGWKILTLLNRSLRVDTRSKSTYFLRVGLLGFGCLWLYIQTQERFGGRGLQLLMSSAFTVCVFITVATFTSFSSAITEEKEDMTLGLLRMTGVNSLNILLGKSLGRFVSASLLILTQLPITVIAVGLGGIDFRQVMSVYVVCGAYLCFACSYGLLWSVVCKNSRRAGFLAGTVLLCYFLLDPATRLIAGVGNRSAAQLAATLQPGITKLMMATSPFHNVGAIYLQSYQATGVIAPIVGTQVGVSLIASVVLLLASWIAFECLPQLDSGPATGSVWRGFRRRRVSRRAWTRAIVWKDYRYLYGGSMALWLKTILYLLLAVLLSVVFYDEFSSSNTPRHAIPLVLTFCFAVIGAIELVFQSARMFRMELNEQTLPGLVALPKSLSTIALQKLLALVLTLAPATAMLFASICGVAFCWDSVYGRITEPLDEPGFYFAIVVVLFLAHLSALYSFYLRHTSVPAAGATIFFAVMVLGMTIQPRNENAFLSLLTFGLATGCLVLEVMILNQLEKFAAR